ncbi:hypothetical protein PGT21_019632 [Puccinia graminis f. sp. tritici]|uniref:Uncharacterized protein n=1 Tax=Puccinia graminis f. sp. tritici TaxID=56615 RepID=A0A5B0Q6B4_PUCGR|nr:hypothetical protein PGT21_019632 [Puccinia graminis f. sp. tritici]
MKTCGASRKPVCLHRDTSSSFNLVLYRLVHEGIWTTLSFLDLRMLYHPTGAIAVLEVIRQRCFVIPCSLKRREKSDAFYSPSNPVQPCTTLPNPRGSS